MLKTAMKREGFTSTGSSVVKTSDTVHGDMASPEVFMRGTKINWLVILFPTEGTNGLVQSPILDVRLSQKWLFSLCCSTHRFFGPVNVAAGAFLFRSIDL
jgi:hypothetical protein